MNLQPRYVIATLSYKILVYVEYVDDIGYVVHSQIDRRDPTMPTGQYYFSSVCANEERKRVAGFPEEQVAIDIAYRFIGWLLHKIDNNLPIADVWYYDLME